MEQTKKKKLIKIIYKMITGMTVFSAVLLFLAFLTSFDADKGYFNSSNSLPVLFQAMFIVTAAGAFASAFLLGKNEVLTPTDKVTSKDKMSYALVGISLVLLGTFSFYLDMGVAFSGEQAYFTGIGSSALGVYYLLVALKESYEKSKLKQLCLFVSLALPIGLVIQNNSYFGRAIHSVENTLCCIFTVAFLLYILYEEKRLSTGEENRWRFASLLLLRSTALIYSGAYLLAYIVGAMDEGGRFYQTLYLLLIGLIANVALSTFVENATKEHIPTVSENEGETVLEKSELADKTDAESGILSEKEESGEATADEAEPEEDAEAEEAEEAEKITEVEIIPTVIPDGTDVYTEE